MNEYPLYPELNEQGNIEAQELMNKFKAHAKKVVDDLLDTYLNEVYTNLLPEIESDSWSNYRNTMMDGFKNYNNRLVQSRYDFKAIRQQILIEYKDQIIADLNQDNLEKIAELQQQIDYMRDIQSNYR